MFECVPADSATKALRDIIEAAKLAGYNAIVVPNVKFRPDGTRLHTFLTHNPHLSMKHCQVVVLDRLLDFARIFFDTAFVQVAAVIMRQHGIPIGGIPSSSLANLVLSSWEHRWMSDTSMRVRAGFPPVPWVHLVASPRYVDDLLQSSSAVCTSCLLSVFPLVYGTMEWEHSPISHNTWSRWLDVELFTMQHRLLLRPVAPSCDGSKFSIPPFVDMSIVNVASLQSLLRGRIARLKQLPISKHQFLSALTSEVAVLAARGFPVKVIKNVCNIPACVRETRLLQYLIKHTSGKQF